MIWAMIGTSISTTVLLGVVVFLVRKWLLIRLEKSITYEYDKKIKKFQDDLKEKSSQIDILRNGALSSIENQQTILYKEKTKAVKEIWKSIITLAGARNATIALSNYNLEKMQKESLSNDKLVEFARMTQKVFNIEKIDMHHYPEARLYLPPFVWALYDAYTGIVIQTHLKLKQIELTLDKNFINYEQINKIKNEIFPDEEIENNDVKDLLEKIESKLLHEFKLILSGKDSDKTNIARANDILKAVDILKEKDITIPTI